MVAPALVALLFIYRYGVNVPLADQWEFVAILEKAYAGKLSITDFFSLHNEHRVAVPRVFMLLFAVVSNYNTLIEMYFGWLLLVLCGAVVFNIYSRRINLSRSTLVRFIPAMWLMFSWRQYENFLWGWQITFFMTAFAVVITFYFLESSSGFDKFFLGAIFSGFIASFSNFNGLLVWPIGLLQIWTGRQKLEANSQNAYVVQGAWVLAATCIYAFYFIGYAKPLHHPSVLSAVTAPIRSLLYLLCVLGSPLGDSLGTALTGGLLLTMIAILLYSIEVKRASRLIFSIWDSLILFVLSTGLMLTVGRSGFGVPQALASRYTTFTILGVVALYLKSFEILPKRSRLNTAVRVVLMGLIAQGVATSFINGVERGENFQASRQEEIYVLNHLALEDDKKISKLWIFDPNKVRQLTPFLAKYKLSFFN